MDIAEINELLKDASDSAAVIDALARADQAEPVVDDLLAALGARALAVEFARLLPLMAGMPDSPKPWTIVGDESATLVARLARLDAVIDNLMNPLVVARVADILWWEEDAPDGTSFVRYGDRSVKAHVTVASSANGDPTDRLRSSWAGSELALRLGKDQAVKHLRDAAIEAAFALVQRANEPDVAGLRLDTGLSFLYAMVARWQSPALRRQIYAVTELAARQIPVLPFTMLPGSDWINRLRYAVAATDEDRVLVVDEVAAQRRAAAALSPPVPGGPLFEIADLSQAAEDAAYLSTKVSSDKLRRRMTDLTRELVVELQNLGWQSKPTRDSLVDQSDLGPDALAAQGHWQSHMATWPSEPSAWIKKLGASPSPLEEPKGLDSAAIRRRAQIVQGRSRIVAMGFVTRDEGGKADLNATAHAEVALQRIEAWGRSVADGLEALEFVEPDYGWFAGPMVPDAIADRFAASLRLFIERDFDACAHVAFPRLEAAIRQVAVALQIPALQVSYGTLGDIGYLARLMTAIEEHVAEHSKGHWRYFRNLLIDPRGGSMRNVLSHGLRRDLGLTETVSRQEAALLIHAASFLASLDDAVQLPSSTE